MTNPENPGVVESWQPDESFEASECGIGLTSMPGEEPDGMVLGMVLEHPVFEMMNQPPMKLSWTMDLEAATRFHEQFAEVLMMLRVSLAAQEA